jgi:NADH:ubiquinone oxidoreductase subunit F (NADH-binding)/NADH:ubiquinone oxidoreductase subunit E/Pyruvate/2-oxoacid:ferredoxin oxidoreductase delta subunit
MVIDLKFVDEAVDRLGGSPDALIPLLQAMQDHYGYLPGEALSRICETTQITPASVSGVASFYDMFRHKPVGKHIVRVCRGTACHVTGAERVQEALRRQLKIAANEDTDPAGEFTVEEVACLGCCTLAPVVRIGEATFGHATPEQVPKIISEFEERNGNGVLPPSTEELLPAVKHRAQISIGLGSCCMAKGSDQLFHTLQETVDQMGADVLVKRVGCVGMCHRTPMIEVIQPGKPTVTYAGVETGEARRLVRRHFRSQALKDRAARWFARAIDSLLLEESQDRLAGCEMDLKKPDAAQFLDRQVHIATEFFGKIDPLNLDEYIAHGGFQALARCLGAPHPHTGIPHQLTAPSPSPRQEERAGERRHRTVPPHFDSRKSGPGRADSFSSSLSPLHDSKSPAAVVAGKPFADLPHSSPEPLSSEEIITLIERSGLRGRGGAGFPTGKKWRVASQQPGETKYVICNGDEGDPGAFMDRMLLESFPYRIIEGLAIAAVAVGAHDCIFYIRHEYPLAVKRVRAAIKLCQQRGWLGERPMGSEYPLRFSIKEGAGAFVCGEETALIASIEGQRGMPRLRPPYPVEQGLWGKPTIINNVETLAMVPWILRHGPGSFAAFGTKESKGTKVFALAGNVQRGGLIEIPMGTTIREIVSEIGGGVRPGRKFKAVQIGGPSGGCVPARLSDTPVDFESLRGVGAIMGSGGLVVLDDGSCMVDMARYFLQFTQNQSCGKCTFCRIGTRRMLDILNRLCGGKGRKEDLAELENLAHQVGAGSLCGLGKTAPNPVLTTLRYFRDEYEAHLQGRCPAGQCTALIKYQILENCTGCTLCAQSCPVDAIPMTPYARHAIDLDKCTRCDSCRQVCPHDAVTVL